VSCKISRKRFIGIWDFKTLEKAENSEYFFINYGKRYPTYDVFIKGFAMVN